jgi:hypothetical protein
MEHRQVILKEDAVMAAWKFSSFFHFLSKTGRMLRVRMVEEP